MILIRNRAESNSFTASRWKLRKKLISWDIDTLRIADCGDVEWFPAAKWSDSWVTAYGGSQSVIEHWPFAIPFQRGRRYPRNSGKSPFGKRHASYMQLSQSPAPHPTARHKVTSLLVCKWGVIGNIFEQQTFENKCSHVHHQFNV